MLALGDSISLWNLPAQGYTGPDLLNRDTSFL